MVSVVTVNYKTKDYLEAMLTSLFKYHDHTRLEVLVVENGSGDDLSDIEDQFPHATFIYNKENLGFAGGCNTAIPMASGDYVLLVNPDIVFTDDAIHQMEEKMSNNPKVGIGGVSLKNYDNTQQDCVWSFPTPVDQLLVLLKVPHVFKNLAPINRWLMKGFDYTMSQEVDQVMGAFFCIRRDVIDRIGLMDNRYFLWYEEVDYAKMAHDASWPTRYFADITVLHKKGSSFDRVTTLKKQKALRRSIRYYMKKHYGSGTWLFFAALEPAFILTALIASIIKPQ